MANFSIQCDKYIKRGSLAHLLLCPNSSVMDISFIDKGQREKHVGVILGKQQGKKHPLMNMKALRCWGACLNHQGHREYVTQILPGYFQARAERKLQNQGENVTTMFLAYVFGGYSVH